MKKLWILYKKQEDITKTNKKNIIFFAYPQGKISRKISRKQKI